MTITETTSATEVTETAEAAQTAVPAETTSADAPGRGVDAGRPDGAVQAGEQGRAAGRTGSVDLAVIGLGYVGLPLAQEASRAGLRVLGIDLNERVVGGLNAGHSHVDDLHDTDIAAMRAAGFEATTDTARVRDADVAVICVPTPLSEEGGPDLRAVQAAVATVAAGAHPGMTIVLESTTYPGTTEELVRPVIEATGHVVGQDIFVAFSPERIDPGRTDYGAKNTPKVVGGCTRACTMKAAEFYGRFVDHVVTVKGTREAEMAKLLENTYRHVNIALVNEMAMFCHELDIDLWESIRAASTKPFGFQAFYPGPGVGGHCIPIDPNYLSHRVRAKLKTSFRFVELAQDINAKMPNYVVLRAAELLNDHAKALRGSTVLLLGVTYKPDIADQRESPAVDIAKMFEARGARVVFHDPFVQTWRINGHSLERVPDLDAALAEADLTVVLQPHRSYDLDDMAARTPLLFDTRGRTLAADNVELL